MSNPVCQFSLIQNGPTIQVCSNNVVPSPWSANSESIDWGDGSGTETLSFQNGGTNPEGGGATHTYNANGTFTITASLGANQGGGLGGPNLADSYFVGYGTAEVTSYQTQTTNSSGQTTNTTSTTGVGPGGSGPAQQGVKTSKTSTNASQAPPPPPPPTITPTDELYIVLAVVVAAVVIAIVVLRRKKA